MLSTAMIEARVGVSERMLDQSLPGWDACVNPESLDIEYSCHCVLGQIFGNFETGCRRLQSLGVPTSRMTGFVAVTGKGRATDEYAQLTRAWLDRLKARRPQGQPKETALAA